MDSIGPPSLLSEHRDAVVGRHERIQGVDAVPRVRSGVGVFPFEFANDSLPSKQANSSDPCEVAVPFDLTRWMTASIMSAAMLC